jgi:hypothetical protein
MHIHKGYKLHQQTVPSFQGQTNQNRSSWHKRKTGARSRNHYCREEAIRITHSECVCVCLEPELTSMQSACAVLYCHLWPDQLYRDFPHYLINDTTFGKKLLTTNCVF